MKIGDTVPVTIAGHVVAQAQIKELADGTATLIVPATRVLMGVSTSLTDIPSNAPTHEVMVDSVEQKPSATVDGIDGNTANPVPNFEQNTFATSEYRNPAEEAALNAIPPVTENKAPESIPAPSAINTAPEPTAITEGDSGTSHGE